MTKATLELPLEQKAETIGRTSVLNSIWALFAMTVARQALSRRSLVMAVLYLLPVAFTLLDPLQRCGISRTPRRTMSRYSANSS